MFRYILAGISIIASCITLLTVLRIDEYAESSDRRKLSIIENYDKTNSVKASVKKYPDKVVKYKFLENKKSDIKNKKEYHNEDFFGKKIAVLCYHRIDKNKKDDYYITKEKFLWQIQTLAKNKCVISTDTLVNYIYYKKGFLQKKINLPKNPVVIHFDDNYKSVYKDAYPILKKYKLPWTFFVYKYHHNPIDKSDLIKMARDGVDIQSHSMTHPWFHKTGSRQSLNAYINEMHWQIGGSKKYLQKISLRPVVFLAYPFGTYSDLAIKLCSTYKYRAMFAADGGYATKQSKLYAIERILVTKNWSKDYFKKVIGSKCRFRKVYKPSKMIKDKSVVKKLSLPYVRFL